MNRFATMPLKREGNQCPTAYRRPCSRRLRPSITAFVINRKHNSAGKKMNITFTLQNTTVIAEAEKHAAEIITPTTRHLAVDR
jgi:hypothetical protein